MFLFTDGKFAAYNSVGAPLSGGKLYSYEAGTTTPLATYTTQGGATANANPVVLDASGRADVWLTSASYRMILKDASDVTIWDVDNISGGMTAIDLANDTSATKGAGLVGFDVDLAYAAGTVGAKLTEWRSVMDNGAVGDGTTDDTSAIQAAINAVGASGTVYFPPGTYKVTSTLTVANNRVHLVGAGAWATRILFAPTANDTCLELNASGSVLYQGSVRGMCFYSTDSTYTKIAIDVVDTSGYLLDDIVIGGSVSVSGNSFWSGNSSSSVGIRYRGREACNSNRLYIFADKPIQISENPNNSIDIDHFHFSNCYLGGNANPLITIDTGINLTQVTFDGYQVWVLGTYGLYWSDTTSAQASIGLHIKNVRSEQGTSSTAYQVYIAHNYELQSLTLENMYGGSDRRGVYLRKCVTVSLKNYYHVGTTNEVLNVDSTVKRITGDNCYWGAGSSATMTGQRLVWGAPLNPNTAPLPPTFVYDESANGDRDEKHDGWISSTRVTVANDGTTAIGGTNSTGYLLISTDEGASAIFVLNGGNHSVAEVSDPSSVFTAASGGASSTNIYWSAGNSQYELENKRGSSVDYTIVRIGAYAGV